MVLFSILYMGMLKDTLQAQSVLNVRVNNALNDLEEYLPATINQTQSKTVGAVDNGSSDLELGGEVSGGNDPQLVGIRFAGVSVPKGALITKATIQFTVDATNKNTDPCVLTIVAESSDNAAPFTGTASELSSRTKSTTSVVWNIAAGTWNAVGSAGENERTPDLKSLVQELVNRNSWSQGNAMAFYFSGTGTREAEAYDGSASQAPLLSIEYFVPIVVSSRISAPEDDLEEYMPGSVAQPQSKGEGTYDIGSSDLELGGESIGGHDPQLVGMRFRDIRVPQGAQIANAKIIFTVDAIAKNTDPCELEIIAESTDNASSFTTSATYHLSSRPKTANSVEWNIPSGSWSAVGQNGADQTTPDLKLVVQELVNRSGWTAGNAMAFFISGSGTREAEAYDGSASQAPLLEITYYGLASNPVSDFPVSAGSSWSFNDSGIDLGTSWRNASFTEDDEWVFGNAPLGYGETSISKVVSFGSNAESKYPTTYFTKRFQVTNLSSIASTLDLSLMCDDGAIVYLNGVEVARKNMPAGTVGYSTLASTAIEDNTREGIFSLFEIPKSSLLEGLNYLAVEVHQATLNSSDLRFDLTLSEATSSSSSPSLGCAEDQDHVACFESILPAAQDQLMHVPSSHAFQLLFSEGDSYTQGTGVALGNFDFTGFIPSAPGNSTSGYVAVNHETNPGGVSLLSVSYQTSTEKWIVNSSKAVDFSTTDLVKTERNCSGGITPWNTLVTCEETMAAGDVNTDGYQDVGWNVEIDPVSGMVKEYGNAKREKLWAMGRMSHENVAFLMDSLTSYYGEDASNGCVYKFVADAKMNLSQGKLYVLKLASALSSNEPTSSTGVWELVPNTTQADRNNTPTLAIALGATIFSGVEDVELSPVDGKIYFTAKGNNRVYRFSDNGSTVSNFETFVGGKSYKINSSEGIINEAWGSGNDNLTFDEHGNLWVLQDGSRNHIWMVRKEHTQQSPKIELFMRTPIGSEPTGMTFTPDHRFMFLSIQAPATTNTQSHADAKGTQVTYNKNHTFVLARTALMDGLNVITNISVSSLEKPLVVYPNPSKGIFTIDFSGLSNNEALHVKVVDVMGHLISEKTIEEAQAQKSYSLSIREHGIYFIKVVQGDRVFSQKVIVE